MRGTAAARRRLIFCRKHGWAINLKGDKYSYENIFSGRFTSAPPYFACVGDIARYPYQMKNAIKMGSIVFYISLGLNSPLESCAMYS